VGVVVREGAEVVELEVVELGEASSGYTTKLPSEATWADWTAMWRVPSVLRISAVTWTSICPLELTLLLILLVSMEPRMPPTVLRSYAEEWGFSSTPICGLLVSP